jgi:hypothetical protein
MSLAASEPIAARKTGQPHRQECLCYSAVMAHEGKGLTSFSGGCGSKGRGFVWQFFIDRRRGRLFDARRWGFGLDGGGCERFGRRRFSGLLQFAERMVRAFVYAVEAGFVTGDERNGSRLVDQAAESERHPIAGIAGGFGCGQLALHFTIQEGGFHHTEAQDAPAASNHFVDKILFDRAAGLISFGIIGEHFLESIRIFAGENYGFLRSEPMSGRIMRRFFLSFGGL